MRPSGYNGELGLSGLSGLCDVVELFCGILTFCYQYSRKELYLLHQQDAEIPPLGPDDALAQRRQCPTEVLLQLSKFIRRVRLCIQARNEHERLGMREELIVSATMYRLTSCG